MTLRCCDEVGDSVVFGALHKCTLKPAPERESLASLAARASYVLHRDPDNLHPYEDNLSSDERCGR